MIVFSNAVSEHVAWISLGSTPILLHKRDLACLTRFPKSEGRACTTVNSFGTNITSSVDFDSDNGVGATSDDSNCCKVATKGSDVEEDASS